MEFIRGIAADFEAAKALLIENALGHNSYEHLTTWAELGEAADFERQCATDRIRQLGRVESAVNENTADS
jgi:hypothetical protein